VLQNVKHCNVCVYIKVFTEFTEASISDDTDGMSKHRLTPITPTLKHDNTQ